MGWINKILGKEEGKSTNTKDEKTYVAQVLVDKIASQGGYRADAEPIWDDEYLCKIGKQWDMSIAPRDRKKKSKRPNIVSNITLPTSMNILDALTASTPAAHLTGRGKEDKQTALKLMDLVTFIFERNVFPKQWRDIAEQGIDHGPFIGFVPWDADFMGGSGPNRWVGEVGTKCQDRNEIYFDPAIKDLEEYLNDCRFIHQRYPKNLDYIKDKWPKYGKYVVAELLEGTDNADSSHYQRATVIRSWHRGLPKFLSDEDKTKYLDKASKTTDKYRKKMFQDMATGTLKGIHCAYSAGDVFLEYTSYVYEDGLYPFAYAVLYRDEKSPYGYGEIRNIMSPQVAYNKCFEVEMAAVAAEGLGGGYYNKGSATKPQMAEINENGHRAAIWHEVNSTTGMKDKTGVRASQNLIELKVALKEGVDITTQNNAIQQGISPGANVPYASIKELGARGDNRNNGKMNILERFMTQFIRLMISRITEFYTDEREYRIRGDKSQAIQDKLYQGFKELTKIEDKKAQLTGMIQLFNTIKTMNPNEADSYDKFSNKEMKRTWERTDKNNVKHEEEYIAEFDLKVGLADERPTSRAYHEQIAMQMFQFGAIGPKAFWTTIVDGSLPTVEEITEEMNSIKQEQAAQEQASKAQKQPSTKTPQQSMAKV